VSIDMMLSIGN